MNRPNKKGLKNILIVTLGVLGLLGIISGILLWLVTSPAPTNDWGVSWITTSDDALASLNGKIKTLQNDINNASTGKVFVLTITEEEATAKLDQYARQGNISIETYVPQVHFKEGLLLFSARIHIGVRAEMAIQITVEAVDGKADFTIRRLDLGRVTIPRTLVNNVMTAVEHEVVGHWDKQPVVVNKIAVEEGVLKVTMEKK